MLLLLLLQACTPEEPPLCEAFPDAPTPADGTLHNADGCGWWELPVGEQLIVSVVMTEPDHECEGEMGDGLALVASPMYSNMSNDEPKMTFQMEGVAPVTAFELYLTCTEGTEWLSKVDVVE